MGIILFAIALMFLLWGIISSMVILSFLSSRGVKINIPLLGLFFYRYISQYRKITIGEDGKTGFWFFSFIVSMNLALIFTVFGLLLRT